MRKSYLLGLLAVVLGASGCTAHGTAYRDGDIPTVAITHSYAMPTVLEQATACANRTGILHGKIYLVSQHADGTNKGNAVADGNNGAILSQGPTAYLVRSVLSDMGAEVTRSHEAPGIDYALSTAHVALDIEQKSDGTLIITGFGANVQTGISNTMTAAEIFSAQNGLLQGDHAVISLGDYYGVGPAVGRVIGGELVTGEFTVFSQTHLMRASVESAALAAVYAVYNQFPALQAQCGDTLSPLRPRQRDDEVLMASAT